MCCVRKHPGVRGLASNLIPSLLHVWPWTCPITSPSVLTSHMKLVQKTCSQQCYRVTKVAQTVKRLPAMRETRVWFLGREDPLEKEIAIHSSTLAWKIPWTEEPDRLQSMGSQRVGLSLSGYFFGAQRPSGFTFLPRLLRPSREGALRLHPIERAPEAFVNRASPMSGTLLVFCGNQGISASFSILYFLIVDSGPSGSGPLKDLNSLLSQALPCPSQM